VGLGRVEGIANRGTFDLTSHEKESGKDLVIF
jgi:glycyl-tRNA synthetase (class II)